jgi:hypothetical protein
MAGGRQSLSVACRLAEPLSQWMRQETEFPCQDNAVTPLSVAAAFSKQ